MAQIYTAASKDDTGAVDLLVSDMPAAYLPPGSNGVVDQILLFIAVGIFTGGLGDLLDAIRTAALFGRGVDSAIELSTFSQSTVDEVVSEVNEPFNKNLSVGARAISKKLGDGAPAFQGVAPTDANAAAIAQDILENPTYTVFGCEPPPHLRRRSTRELGGGRLDDSSILHRPQCIAVILRH